MRVNLDKRDFFGNEARHSIRAASRARQELGSDHP